ncbi:MAG: hypothetical protein HYY04_14800 [Chloroflexi bacterium]|nr:hypothetical protein [Chloroflexota bacterium]
MSDMLENLNPMLDRNADRGAKLLERAFSAAQPGAVFGQPVTVGDYTVITASEVTAGGGFGSGAGFGPPARALKQAAEEESSPSQPPMAGGGGFGGGGGSAGRPVAAIVIGPGGVKVQPIVDLNKIGLAAITAGGAMLIVLGRMCRSSAGSPHPLTPSPVGRGGTKG